MNPDDLLTIAEKLMAGGMVGAPGHPSDTELRRAISCTYYAMFHALCRCCAYSMVGQNPTGLLAEQKWEQAYRALDHCAAKRRCNNNQEMGKFTPEVQKFAEMFVDMQQQRHDADYNPNAAFTHSSVQQSVTEAKATITQFQGATADDRRLFAVYLLVNIRQT